MSAAARLDANLDPGLPASLPVGRGNAIVLRGEVSASGEAIGGLAVECDKGAGEAHELCLGIPTGHEGNGATPQAGRGAGIERPFWGIVPFEPPARPVELTLRASLRDGSEATTALGAVELEAPDRAAEASPAGPGAGPLVAICMATFDPPAGLFERQVESIRAQTHPRWVCVISDDGSAPEGVATVERVVGDDERFFVSRSEQRLGFYRNFERALALAPAEATHIALADQDDRWHPEKLERLVSALGPARLVYSDARTIAPDGRVIAESLWRRRRNNRANLASLLLSNSVTGAASLFERDLLELALPFPPAPGRPYHDHWIALVALASGELAYVDLPLLDYVQHPSAVIGSGPINAGPGLSPFARARRMLADRRGTLSSWRQGYFEDWHRTLLFATVLALRTGERMDASKRRGLERVLAGEDAPGTLAWLALRPLRTAVGPTETHGFEYRLLRGIAWRHLSKLGRHDSGQAGRYGRGPGGL